MSNRTVFIILGLVLIVVAVMGLLFFQIDQRRKAEIKQIELVAKEAEGRAREAEEYRKREEERKQAELARQQALAQEQAVIDAQRRKAEEEALRKQQEEEARQRRAEEEQKRLIAQREQDVRARTTSFTVSFDPNNTEIPLASVYAGDDVTISVNRQGADEQLFVGLLPAEAQQAIAQTINRDRERAMLMEQKQRERNARMAERDPGRALSESVGQAAGNLVGALFSQLPGGSSSKQATLPPQLLRYYAQGPDGTPTLVTMPIKDSDHFTVSDQINALHPMSRSFRVDSPKGNILYIGTGLAQSGRSRPGTFVINITIYSNNKWKMMPRRLS